MLELLAQVDPLAALMAGLWLFAAGMFPVGLLMGGCPCCGGCPPAWTVTLSGYKDQYGEPVWLTKLTFEGCFGSGAEARVSAPYVEEPGELASKYAGPIDSIEITKAGSGYAKFGRVAPTLTIIGGSGSGATFTPTLASSDDECGIPSWSLSSIEMSGGSGYVNGDELTITAAAGDTEVVAAAARIRPKVDEPQNAILTIYTNAGPGYPSPGTGAVLEPVWELLPRSQWPTDYEKTYRLASVNVINGGSGYGEYDFITLSFSSLQDGEALVEAYIDADIPGSGGTIQQIFVGDWSDVFTYAPAGKYIGAKPSGQLAPAVTTPGKYYREDAGEPPYVADVTISLSQVAPSEGTGAVLEAVIDDDTSSGTFGQITGVTITSAGDDYLAYVYKLTRCATYYNDRTIVVPLSSEPGYPCGYGITLCDQWDAGQAVLFFYTSGPGAYKIYAPHEKINEPQGFAIQLDEITPNDPPGGWTATNDRGITAKVSPGGTPSDYMTAAANNWFPCCRGSSTPPDEIEVEVWSRPGVLPGPEPAGPWQFEYNAVLCRSCAYGETGCRATWVAFTEQYIKSYFPLQYEYGRFISLTIEQCGDADKGCDGCYRQCRARASLAYRGMTYIFESEPCDGCEASPLCAPPAGEYYAPLLENATAGWDYRHSWKMIVT